MKCCTHVKVLCCITVLFLFLSTTLIAETAVKNKTDKLSPVLVLPQSKYVFPQVVEGKEIIHDFIVQNKGKVTLEIKKINPG